MRKTTRNLLLVLAISMIAFGQLTDAAAGEGNGKDEMDRASKATVNTAP